MSKEKIKIEKPEKTEAIEEKQKPAEEPSLQEGKVGTMLRDVRIKKKLTIDDIADKLRIKAAYLNAIENSDYDSIPQPPYGIGFIQSYANYLGLNSSRIIQIFKEETEGPSNTTHMQEKTPTEQPITPEEDTPVSNHKYIIISLILLILCYGLWYKLSSDNNVEEEITVAEPATTSEVQEYPMQVESYTEETETPVESNEEIEQINITEDSFIEEEPAVSEENKSQEESEEKITEQETPNQPDKVAEPKKTGRVVLKIKKETWVEVKDENKLWISKVLNAGDEYVLPENGVGKTVSFGNTDGVDVMIDGKIVTIISNNKKTNIKMDAFLGNH